VLRVRGPRAASSRLATLGDAAGLRTTCGQFEAGHPHCCLHKPSLSMPSRLTVSCGCCRGGGINRFLCEGAWVWRCYLPAIPGGVETLMVTGRLVYAPGVWSLSWGAIRPEEANSLRQSTREGWGRGVPERASGEMGRRGWQPHLPKPWRAEILRVGCTFITGLNTRAGSF
jgi:hypothetical protein